MPINSGGPEINPNMVILARESRGLTQSQLAKILEVPQSRISMIEAGLRPVSDELLEQLVEALEYPPQHFYQVGVINGVGIPEIFHRKRQNVTKSFLMRLYAVMELRLVHLQNLLRSLDVEDCGVERMNVDDFKGLVEEIARSVKAQLHVPRGPIADLTDVLESAGIVVWAFDFGSPTVDAVSMLIPNMPPVIFTNSSAPTDRLRFSMAHELGHFVMHKKPNPEMEEQADRFAAEFLMPERDINFDFSHVDLVQLTTLKSYWRVSMAALLKRAETLRMISPNRARYLWAQIGKAGYRMREPVDLDIDIEHPSLVRELIEMHENDLGYSESELQELLPLREKEFREWYTDQLAGSGLRLVR